MPWREGIGTPFVLTSQETPVLEVHSDNESLVNDKSINSPDVIEQTSEPSASKIERILEEMDGNDSRASWELPLPCLSASEPFSEVSEPQPSGHDLSISNFVASLRHDSCSSSDALQPSDVFARVVSNSVVSQATIQIPAMPWETGPMRAIFCDQEVQESKLTVPLENEFREDHFQSEPASEFP